MSKFQIVREHLIYSNPDSRVAVFRGRIQPQNLAVAIKEEVHSSAEAANSSLREAMAMKGLSHENICKILDCFMEMEQGGGLRIVLVTELMESDLEQETGRRRRANLQWQDSELYYLLRSLVSAFAHAAEQSISHRDIKPQNIFYSNGVVKVGDFGSSTVLRQNESTYSLQGSPMYLSPELKRAYVEMLRTGGRHLHYDPIKSDVYSLGMTMLYLILLAPPNELANLQSLEADTQRLLGSLTAYPYMQFFLQLMLAVDSERRPTFTNLLEIFAQIESAGEQQAEAPPLRCSTARRDPRKQRASFFQPRPHFGPHFQRRTSAPNCTPPSRVHGQRYYPQSDLYHSQNNYR